MASPRLLDLDGQAPFGLDDRPWLADTVMAIVLALVSVATISSIDESFTELSRPSSVLDWLIVMGPVLVVPFRRVAPISATIVGAVLQCVLWATTFPDYFLATSVMLYSIAAHGGTVGRRIGWVTGVALTAFTTFGYTIGAAPVYAIPIVAFFSAAALALGTAVANRHAYTEAVEARALHAERERAADRERALTEERNRIARELHDVVAHGLSVIVVQSAAAQRILERDPEGARNALGQIEQTGRRALGEMRHVLAAIRTDPGNESWRPAPGLADLDELIDDLNGIGLRVSLTETGEQRADGLPSTVDMTAYRIVQESLTNVLKHGGAGASAAVNIDHSAESLELAITDDGRGAAADPSDGHGLRGMQERVEVFGGRFQAGPRLGGGFSVKVSLPYETADR